MTGTCFLNNHKLLLIIHILTFFFLLPPIAWHHDSVYEGNYEEHTSPRHITANDMPR